MSIIEFTNGTAGKIDFARYISPLTQEGLDTNANSKERPGVNVANPERLNETMARVEASRRVSLSRPQEK